MKKLIILLVISIGPSYAMAQQPKMHIKLFGGWNSSRMVYRLETLNPDLLPGWQAGGGFRVMQRKTFLEADITFLKYGITLEPYEGIDLLDDEPQDIRIRSLQIPLNIGYVAVKKPALKWFLYGGLVNQVNLNGQYMHDGIKESFRPKELQLHIYNLGARFGTQLDIGIINIDFSYTLGLTNTFETSRLLRTNMHTLVLSAGFAL